MMTVEKIRSCFAPISLPFAASGIFMIRNFWIIALDFFSRRWLAIEAVYENMCKIWPCQRSALPFLLAICLPLVAHSAEVLDSSVTQQQERYMMHTETVVQAPVSKVRALLMDYENFPRLNSDIKRIESLGRLDDGGIRMAVRSAVCILAICQHFDWVQDIRFLPDGDIAMTIVPDQGDFRQGNGRWRLLPNQDGTRLIFDLDLTPKNWVPPLFGPWLMKRKLTDDAFEFAQGLEMMAISNCC